MNQKHLKKLALGAAIAGSLAAVSAVARQRLHGGRR